MKFLEHTYVWEWCSEHGFPLTEGAPEQTLRLAPDARLHSLGRQVHGAATDPMQAFALAQQLIALQGAFDECLAWATDWDVWENEEDWPAFYAWRGDRGERRSLGAAPGHLFGNNEGAELEWFLAHALRCSWDVTFICIFDGQAQLMRMLISHDEWYEVQVDQPVALPVRVV